MNHTLAHATPAVIQTLSSLETIILHHRAIKRTSAEGHDQSPVSLTWHFTQWWRNIVGVVWGMEESTDDPDHLTFSPRFCPSERIEMKEISFEALIVDK